MQDPSPIHDTFQSNEDLLNNIQLDHRKVWNRHASSDDTSRPRGAHIARKKSGAPAGTPALSKSELEALEGRGISPSNFDVWIKLQFDFNQVNCWFTSGFSPNDAQQRYASGFSPTCAAIWLSAGFNLEWTTVFHKLRKQTAKATPWMKLSKYPEEVFTAIQGKISPDEYEKWVKHKFNLYEATEYFLQFVPCEAAKEISGLKMKAEESSVIGNRMGQIRFCSGNFQVMV
ncbi:hypothetical protein DSO57_1028644 [Entomophthora muscae]|uniref:Uncharacterized protein n=1 Tax=Entomophthora muscae TaxID=34485 RepID=A0ACC2ULT9_9FUNG|nr:hypothetical protein DSO57_1028644 [Entomophthora muscae]